MAAPDRLAKHMVINWKGLFAELGVACRDRGENWSRGNINIKCPFCANDPSFHLSIAENKQAYFCRRDSRHKGRDLVYLLGKLGVRSANAEQLLRKYSSGKLELREQHRAPPRPPSQTLLAWDRFLPAQDNIHILAYLKNERGFPLPAVTCEAYDLRYARAGAWAQRILMPFRDAEWETVSWVGRAIHKDREPRYLMENSSIPALLYMPRMARRILMTFEGPFDALKVAAATEAEDLSTLGLLGKHLSPAKLLLLTELAKDSEEIYWTPDYGVPLGERESIRREMQGALQKPVKLWRLPDGAKDSGAMSFTDVREWLKPIL